MRWGLSILLALFLFVSESSRAGGLGSADFHFLSNVKLGSTQYTVAVIEPNSSPLFRGEIDDKRQDLASLFLDRANEWGAKEYEIRYPEIDPKFFEEMKHVSLNDGRSAMVIIFKDGDIHQIQGTLRFAWDGAGKSLLPFEEKTGYRYPRNEPVLKEYETGRNVWKDLEIPFPRVDAMDTHSRTGKEPAVPFKEKQLGLVGGAWEIKSFIVKEGVEEDLVPLLYFVAEKTGISHWSPKIVKVEGYDFWTGIRRFPAEYVIYCDQKMVPYYRRLGFQKKDVVKSAENLNIMTISRADYLKFVGDKFKNRSGASALPRMIWDHSISKMLHAKEFLRMKKVFGYKCTELLHEPVIAATN